MKIQDSGQGKQVETFFLQIKYKSDKLVNYFLIGYFIVGLILAIFYDTWSVAFGVGGLSLIAYYSVKLALPKSNLYQYVLSGVLGIFMAQYIFQMHGLFEMHFLAFIGSAILITYQNWKLQLPILIVVVLHHGVFAYLQYSNVPGVYFTQLDFMDLRTFILHIVLSAVIFFICGIWAFQFKKFSEQHIDQSFEIGRLQIADAQREELKKANLELDKFVYSVSHDLRAPLKSMSGIVEITAEISDDSMVHEHMGMLKSSISKLDAFIIDMLDSARNARADIKKEEINFSEMLNDITNNLKHMSDNHRMVIIEVNVNDHKPYYSDKGRINVLLSNLISNAIRYQNPEISEPFVKIIVDTSDKEANIVINDNGIGISDELHDKIFEMFYRVTENSVGTGLGLYLVKETVDKLQGQICVESKPGIGTKFSLNIPNLYSQQNQN